jgi:DNA-binding transcriptional LysR family regulator
MKTPPQVRKADDMSLTATLRDLNKLNTFVRVGERRSFTKAAADLRTTPSVVSKRMKELEAALGFTLINRSTHGIVLTDAGEGLFQSCLQMLSQIDDYVVEARNLQKVPAGTLRVLATGDYARWVLAPLILEFARRHPGLRVHLFVVTDSTESAEDGFDVIVAGRKPASPGLVNRDLGAIQHVVCASPEYFRRLGRPKEPQDLREHSCLTNLFSGPKDWPFRTGSRQLLVDVKGMVSSNSNEVLIRMALQGYGIIRVPLYAVKAELESKSLDAIFEGMTLSPERMAAYFSKARHRPAKTTDFVRFLHESIAAA